MVLASGTKVPVYFHFEFSSELCPPIRVIPRERILAAVNKRPSHSPAPAATATAQPELYHLSLAELSRFLRVYLEFVGLQPAEVERRLPKKSDKSVAAWVPRCDKKGSLRTFGKREESSDEQDLWVPVWEAYPLADAYRLPYQMLDSMVGKASSGPFIAGDFSGFLKPQEAPETAAWKGHESNRPRAGLGYSYGVPHSRLAGSNLAIVRVRLGSQGETSGSKGNSKKKPDPKAAAAKGATNGHVHLGDELAYVISGQAQLVFDHSGVSTLLGPSTLCHFYAEQPHQFVQVGPEPCEIIVIRLYQLEPLGTRLRAMKATQEMLKRLKTHYELDNTDRKTLRDVIGPWFLQYTAQPHWDGHPVLSDKKHTRELYDAVGFSLLLREYEATYSKEGKRFLDLEAVTKRSQEEGWLGKTSLHNLIHCEDPPFIDLNNLSVMAKVFEIQEPLLYPYFFPTVPRCVVVKEGECVPFPAAGQKCQYLMPKRKLAGSDTAIAILELNEEAKTVENRHPGFELLIVLSGQITVRFPRPQMEAQQEPGKSDQDEIVECTVKEGGFIHFRSKDYHIVSNTGKGKARILLVRSYESHENVKSKTSRTPKKD